MGRSGLCREWGYVAGLACERGNGSGDWSVLGGCYLGDALM